MRNVIEYTLVSLDGVFAALADAEGHVVGLPMSAVRR
jgi:hypothetical protein